MQPYPLGIVKFNNQTIVRDPIYIDQNKNIVLVGDIFQNSTINILRGDVNNLIKSSGTASLYKITVNLITQSIKIWKKWGSPV